jgi:hypothetical protein
MPFDGGYDSAVVLLTAVYAQQAIPELGSAPAGIVGYANLGVCVIA